VDFTIEQWINCPAGTHPFWDGMMSAAAVLSEPLFIALVTAWFLIGWLHRRAEERRGAIAAGRSWSTTSSARYGTCRARSSAIPEACNLLLNHSELGPLSGTVLAAEPALF
jgi:hypothetical protein